MTTQRPPLPPFTVETAIEKASGSASWTID
jgi:nuclear transport factor 2 (NTF2) superfamily protein